MTLMKMLLIIPVALFYFSVSWLTPWHEFAPGSTVSASYVFDLVFILIVFLINKELKIIGTIKLAKLAWKTVFIILFALCCLFLIHLASIKTPFKFVDNLFLQMIILAPLIEEFVFRESFFTLQARFSFTGKRLLFVNSFLFSLSHYSGALLLPAEFHSFLYFQLAYTFPLGWICAKARMLSDGVLEPIVLHLVFNVIFYLGVTHFGI